MPASYGDFVTESGNFRDTFVAQSGHFCERIVAFLWNRAGFALLRRKPSSANAYIHCLSRHGILFP